MKKSTGRHRKTLSLHRLAFEEAVSGLLSAKPADLSEKAAQKPVKKVERPENQRLATALSVQ